MSLLLDTHALLWWLAGESLRPELRDRIADATVGVTVSAVTAWEISVKCATGKLRFEGSLGPRVEANGFSSLPITFEHAERAGSLPLHHRDPFDRMLVAQAQLEGLTVVTRDRAFDRYDVSVLRC